MVKGPDSFISSAAYAASQSMIPLTGCLVVVVVGGGPVGWGLATSPWTNHANDILNYKA